MSDFNDLFNDLLFYLSRNNLASWRDVLPLQIDQGLSTQRFGDLTEWLSAYNTLPNIKANWKTNDGYITLTTHEKLTAIDINKIESAFKSLIPWRKGPYNVFGLTIETEWRSDYKWSRIESYVGDLSHKLVLDVGCGNGYHMWRALESGAARVIGIDPSPRFVVQFHMIKHFLNNPPIDLLPIGIEQLPENLQTFDMTFSMGVLYHRRSPMDHLRELKNTLKPGAKLVLETLVIPGELGETLVPEGRYAKMKNIWFLPSIPTLISWMKKCGYINIECVDVNQTSTVEQRATDWMKFQSLTDFLDPENSDKTIEGHPAPLRAVILAQKPN